MRTTLSLEALEVIDAIDRRGSFAAAAAVLHKVPSAVSYTVQKLEQDLDVNLFQKQGRRAVLTAAGRHLVDEGRHLLMAAQALAAGTQQIAIGWEPRLRIAVDTIVPLAEIMPLLRELQAVQPRVEVSLATEVLAGSWEALLEDRVELLIGGVEGVPGRKGLCSEPWRRVRHCFVAAPDHPVCAEPAPISVEAVRRHHAVVISDTSRNSATLSRGMLGQQSCIYVPTMEAKVEAHCQGLGVGFVPESHGARQLASGRLVALEVAEPQQDSQLCLAWKLGNRGQGLHFLIERLRDIADITS
ncbi:MAG: LysR substrate-binding domain-containing protein [Pseudomonadota bacterium]